MSALYNNSIISSPTQFQHNTFAIMTLRLSDDPLKIKGKRMKKLILISAIAATSLFANMMTDVAKDAAVSKAKSEARTTVVKEVAGDDAVKTEVANKVADEALGKEDPMDKMKTDAMDSMMGSKTATPETGSVVDKVTEGATKETSMTDKAVDMAAEKAVGSNPVKKEVAKEAIKSVL